MSLLDPRLVPLPSGRRLTIRSAVPTDAEAVLAISRAVLSEGRYHIMRPEELTRTVEAQAERIHHFGEAPGKGLIVAELDGAVIGLMEGENDGRQRMAHRVTAWTSILPDHREQGIGLGLAAAGIDWAEREPGIEKLVMPVLATNTRSLALCRAMGLVEETRHLREVKLGPGEYVDLVVMVRWVKGAGG